MDATEEMYVIADELRSIADLGLHFAESNYDNDRYKRVRSLSARLVAAIENRPADDVMEEYMGPLVRATPFVCAEAAVFQEERILLIRREDNGLWAMPGGATEVGETWAESVERELREETGVQGAASKLLGVFDSRMWRSRANNISMSVFGWSNSAATRSLSPVQKRRESVFSQRRPCLTCRRAIGFVCRRYSNSCGEIFPCLTLTQLPTQDV